MVPKSYTYGTEWLKDTEDGQGNNIDPSDLECTSNGRMGQRAQSLVFFI